MSSSSKTPEETRIIVVLSTMIYQKHCVMLALFTRPTFCHFQLLLKALKEGAIWYLRKGKNAVLFCEMLFMSEVHLCLFKSGTYVVQFRYGARHAEVSSSLLCRVPSIDGLKLFWWPTLAQMRAYNLRLYLGSSPFHDNHVNKKSKMRCFIYFFFVMLQVRETLVSTKVNTSRNVISCVLSYYL